MARHKSTETHAFIRRPCESGGCLDLEFGHRSHRPLIATWILETALMFGLYKKQSRNQLPDLFAPDSPFMKVTGFRFPAKAVEADEDLLLNDAGVTKLGNRQIADLLRQKSLHWQKQMLPRCLPLMKNIEMLGSNLGLTGAEMATLFFAAYTEAYNPFNEFLGDWSPRFNTRTVAKFVGRLMGYTEGEILLALHPESTLARIGLVTVDNSYRMLEHKFDLMNGLPATLSTAFRSSRQLLSRFMVGAAPGDVPLNHFDHFGADIESLKLYLSNVVRQKTPGVNILFYGDPGTGKTELTKALAQDLGLSLFEVTYKGDDGEVLKGHDRLKAFNFCQRILEKGTGNLIMFDEIEDVFSSGSSLLDLFGLNSSKQLGKAWINRVMETNPVPSIWITNDAEIDPAYLRRFDYSVRFPKPPKAVRLRMARHHFGALSSNGAWLEEMASHEEISPAQLKTAAKVARVAGQTVAQRREIAARTLKCSMRLLGQTHRAQKPPITTGYDLSLLNADRDLLQLSSGLKRLQAASLCFYGPPGTGKSELGRFLADEVGKPLLLKRASDIMSKWVGETEKQIANMFDEARESDAVLLLDEADSYLRDRRGANNPWEVTQVNELLTQMEAFDGIFICTTNLMENLDQASLRRFAFKIKLDYLTPPQRGRMFVQEYVRIGGSESEAQACSNRVMQLERLTPGDFANVARQLRFHSTQPSASDFLELLAQETRQKQGNHRMGFVTASA